MIVKRIKPNHQRPSASRAKSLVIYATGKSRAEQIESLNQQIANAKRSIQHLDTARVPGEAAATLRLIAALSDALELMKGKPALKLIEGGHVDRASTLTQYSLRMSERTKAIWSSCFGVAGWSTGDAFYSGVTSPSSAEREMAIYATKAPRGGHPIDHLLFSWPQHERPDAQTLLAAANAALQKAGVPRDCPRVLAIHDDTDNLHVHVVLSRYRPAVGKVWSRGRLLDALHLACREVELEFGFTHDNGNAVVIEQDGKKAVVMRDYKSALLSASAATCERRLGEPSFERYIREKRHDIERCAARVRNWQELHRALANEFGVGVKRHGKGFVISDLSSAKSQFAKASLAGIGAPQLEHRFGAWEQASTPLNTLRKSATQSNTSYANYANSGSSIGPSASSAITQLTEERRRKQRAAAQRDKQLRERRMELAKENMERVLARQQGDARRATESALNRSLRALDREEQEAHQRKQKQIREAFRIPKRTPLQLDESMQQPRRSGQPALAILGVSLLLVVHLPGYQVNELEGRVEYCRDGTPVLIDDGSQVTVLSEVSADIEDGIRVLLARDPAAADRGIILSGPDTFCRQAMKVIHRLGLRLANQDPVMQRDFAALANNPRQLPKLRHFLR